MWCPRISPRRCLTYARCIFGYVPISFVCAAPHHCCDPLCNGPASGLKLESIFAACLPHLCRIFAFLLCRIFAASLPYLLQHLCCMFWVRLLLLVCFATSRVPSFTASVAPGRTWLLATPGFTDLHKAPHVPKCLSSKTSVCEKNIPKTRYSKLPQPQKPGLSPKCPYYKTLDHTSALRTSGHCIATVTWAWSPARTLRLVPGGGVWVEPEPGLAPGLCVALALAGH